MTGHPERDWQKQVYSVAKLYGWATYHPPDVDPRRVGGVPYEKGWPDLTLAKPGRVLFVELKAHGNYPSAEQRKWLALLDAAGLEVGVWWPKDLPTVTRVLGPHAERLVLPVRYRWTDDVDTVTGRP
jgi:hypothetical protein